MRSLGAVPENLEEFKQSKAMVGAAQIRAQNSKVLFFFFPLTLKMTDWCTNFLYLHHLLSLKLLMKTAKSSHWATHAFSKSL